MSIHKEEESINDEEVTLNPDQLEKVRRARLLIQTIMWFFILLPFILFLFLHGWSFN
tara:strand:- start:660 stop:830 length:171 start_codon:yes stop_codon:yes gene_type:complete